MMKSIRKKVLDGGIVSGTFLNLGSSLTTEIAGKSGFEWLLIDLEHGSGDFSELAHQLQAAGCTPAAPIVRVAWNEAPRFTFIGMGSDGSALSEGMSKIAGDFEKFRNKV